MLELLKLLEDFGPWAVCMGIILTLFLRQDRWAKDRERQLTAELAKEQSARVADAQRYAELAISLQQKAFEAVESTTQRLQQDDANAELLGSLVDVLRGEAKRR